MMGQMGGGMSDMCPEKVPGTTTRVDDVDGGVTLTFTTTGDVAEVRRRVARMAEMHNQHHGSADGKGMMNMGMMGEIVINDPPPDPTSTTTTSTTTPTTPVTPMAPAQPVSVTPTFSG